MRLKYSTVVQKQSFRTLRKYEKIDWKRGAKSHCKRRASPPHPKTLAISVKTIFVQVVGFCVWPIHCATLASPWRSFRWNALFCWVPCFFLLPLGSFSQVGAACVLQSTFFLQRSRTESGRKNIPKTLKYNRKWVPKSMPGRPKIDKISSLRFRSVFGGSRGGRVLIRPTDLDPFWEPFSGKSRKKASGNQWKNRYRKSERKWCHWSQTGSQNEAKMD